MPQVKASCPDCSQEKGFSLFPTKNWCGLFAVCWWNFRTWLRDFYLKEWDLERAPHSNRRMNTGLWVTSGTEDWVKLLLIMQLAGKHLQLTGILFVFRADNEVVLKMPSFVVVWDKLWFCATSEKEKAETYWIKENSDMSCMFWKDLVRSMGTQGTLT